MGLYEKLINKVEKRRNRRGRGAETLKKKKNQVKEWEEEVEGNDDEKEDLKDRLLDLAD